MRDTKNIIIKEHDVLKNEEKGEMALVIRAYNKEQFGELAVVNDIIGTRDWLDVFPKGVWMIVGNAGVARVMLSV